MNFYTSITQYYDYIFPVNNIKSKFITDYIYTEGGNVLDIGCSTGGFMKHILDKGCVPYGIDLNNDMLKIAKERVPDILSDNIVAANMMDVDKVFDNVKFNLVFSIGNTVAHLDDIDQLNRLFFGVKNVLAEDGLFIIQVVNYNRYEAGKESVLPLIDNDNISFYREYVWDRHDGRVHFDTVLTDKSTGNEIKNREVLTPFIPDEIIRQANDNGFSIVDTFGAFNRNEFIADSSFAFIIVARNENKA